MSVAQPPPAEAPPQRGPIALLAAFTLMTCIPFPAHWQRGIGGREVSAAARWYPLVGIVIGTLAGGLLALLAEAGHPLLGAVGAAVLLFAITGALHLDGLADTFDAIGVRGDRERRLEVMRDSTIGAYGAAAMVSWLLLTGAALHDLATGPWSQHPERIIAAVAFASAAGRLAGVGHGFRLPPARPDGLGVGLTVTPANLLIAVLTVAIPAVAAVAVGWLTPLGLLAVLVAAAAVARLAEWRVMRMLGGRTGDTLGTVTILVELAVLCALVIAA